MSKKTEHAAAGAAESPPPETQTSRRIIDVASLAPPAADAVDPARHRRFWYWCGIVDPDGIGRGAIEVGGVSFPRKNELVRNVDGQTNRLPFKGALLALTVEEVERVAQALASKMIRTANVAQETLGAGDARGTLSTMQRRPTSTIFSIMSADDIAARRAIGQFECGERRQPGDKPLSTALFMVPMKRANVIPPLEQATPRPLSETGLELPGDDWPEAVGAIAWPEGADGVTRT